MSRASSIYSRQILGLDYKIWIVLLCTVLLSITLWGFKLSGSAPCSEISITSEGVISHNEPNVFFTNEGITFSAFMEGTEKIAWDFGDGSPLASGKFVKHSYANEGGYLVTATINGECKESFRVHINKMVVQSKKSVDTISGNPITGNDMIKAGSLEMFSCSEPADFYEWSIKDEPSYGTKTGDTVSYSFSATGYYTIVVRLDHDDNKIWERNIQVVEPGTKAKVITAEYDLPEVPLPPVTTKKDPAENETVSHQQNKNEENKTVVVNPTGPKKYKQIPNQEFQDMLKQVVDKKIDLSAFNEILCSGGETSVMANGVALTFGEVCKEIQKRRGLLNRQKAKIKSLKQTRDPDKNNCVIYIWVEYDW